MIRKTLLALAVTAALIGTGAALFADSFTLIAGKGGVTSGHGISNSYGYAAPHHQPSYRKGKVLEDCLEFPADCALVVW